MLKKLAVPFLTLALATFGCSSSTTNNGTGGSGGGAGTSAAGGKGGGAAGSSAAGTGGGGKAGGGGSAAAGSGGKAGEGGAAGSSAAGTSGGAGGKAGAGGNGGAASNPDGSARSECTVTTSGGTDTLPAAVFCAQMEVNCPHAVRDVCERSRLRGEVHQQRHGTLPLVPHVLGRRGHHSGRRSRRADDPLPAHDRPERRLHCGHRRGHRQLTTPANRPTRS